MSAKTPDYRIYPLRHGKTKIRASDAFVGGDPEEIVDYALYVFLILGGETPMMVDVGLTDLDSMNRGARAVLYEPISQIPEESVDVQLGHFGLTPKDIGHVFITHLHFDHVDNLGDFANARVHMGRREWELATANGCKGSWGHGRIMNLFLKDPGWKERLVLEEDGEILPGVRCFQLGGHTPGSTAYAFSTKHGRVMMPGDTVSLAANLEKPVGVFANREELEPAVATVKREADFVLASHEPRNNELWPPRPAETPLHTIKALYNGKCEVRDYITFQASSSEATRTFNLYVWLVRNGEKTVVVETGVKDAAGFSASTERYIPGGVVQKPEERTPELLRREGVNPDGVEHVLITHLHPDHYDYFDAFPNAQMVVNRREFEESRDRLIPEVARQLESRPEALRLVEEEEILPGIRAIPLGCHSAGSQGFLVETWLGPVLLTGDVVYLYENLEADRIINSEDPDACRRAYAKIRSLTDIILPAHDPLVLKRWPGGIIGALPRP